jgi:hypothetical protein
MLVVLTEHCSDVSKAHSMDQQSVYSSVDLWVHMMVEVLVAWRDSKKAEPWVERMGYAMA